MKNKFILIVLIVFTLTVKAQDLPKVIVIEPIPNQEVFYKDNLNNGVQIEDLSWAWSSQNACFPETQKSKFTRNHVFFSGVIPKYSEITVTVIPKDKNANFSVYAYVLGEGNTRLTKLYSMRS